MPKKLFRNLKVGDSIYGFQHNDYTTSQVEEFVITKMENVNILVEERIQNVWVFEFKGHKYSYRINDFEMDDYFINHIDKYGIELYLSTDSKDEVMKYRDWYNDLLEDAWIN